MKTVTGCYTLSWDGRVLGHEAAGVPEDEIWIRWRPRVMGGKRVPTITGLGEGFPGAGMVLELRKLMRTGDECVARYGVQRKAT